MVILENVSAGQFIVSEYITVNLLSWKEAEFLFYLKSDKNLDYN